MSEYRSALAAARQRIEQLESELAARGSPQRKGPPRVVARRLAVLLVATLAATLGIATVAGAGRANRAPVSVELPAPPPKAPPKAPSGLRWVDPYGSLEGGGPVFADIDGDGKREILGLAWDRNVAADGLYAVAIDRASLDLRWRAGPYPGVWPPGSVDLHHLVAIGDRVVVTDARGGVHVLAAATGKSVLERQLRRTVESACNSEDGVARVFFADDSYWRPGYPGDTGASLFPWEINARARMLFDPVTGKTSPAPFGLGCAQQPSYCSENPYALPAFVDRCRDLYEMKRMAMPPSSLAFSAHESWRSGGDRVALGTLADGEPAIRGWSTREGAPRWTRQLASAVWPAAKGPSRSGIGEGAFAHIYTTQHERLLLSVFDIRTGAPRFQVVLPGSGVGSELRSLVVDQGDVFVGVDDELLLYDANSGQLRKRLVEL